MSTEEGTERNQEPADEPAPLTSESEDQPTSEAPSEDQPTGEQDRVESDGSQDRGEPEGSQSDGDAPPAGRG